MNTIKFNKLRKNNVDCVFEPRSNEPTRRESEILKEKRSESNRMISSERLRDMSELERRTSNKMLREPQKRGEKTTPLDLRPRRDANIIDSSAVGDGDVSRMRDFIDMEKYALRAERNTNRGAIKQEENKKKREEFWEEEQKKKRELISKYKKF